MAAIKIQLPELTDYQKSLYKLSQHMVKQVYPSIYESIKQLGLSEYIYSQKRHSKYSISYFYINSTGEFFITASAEKNNVGNIFDLKECPMYFYSDSNIVSTDESGTEIMNEYHQICRQIIEDAEYLKKRVEEPHLLIERAGLLEPTRLTRKILTEKTAL